jgi:hypothetical protein
LCEEVCPTGAIACAFEIVMEAGDVKRGVKHGYVW